MPPRADKQDEQSWTVPAVLVACTGLSILSTDLYTPSLPHLPRLLASDPSIIQLTMSLNLAAYALAQLAHGPLADRFGRRRLLVIGLCGFFFASLACTTATGIGGLLAGRIAQGLTASVASVVVVLIIRELYDRERAVRVMGVYGMAIGVAPAVGPLIGGYLHVLTGWRSSFLLLAALTVPVLVLVLRFLPETAVGDPRALRPARILGAYGDLLRRPAYLRFLIPLSAVFGSLFAFVTAGPFILIEHLGVATQHYGLYYGLLILAFVAGSGAASRAAGKLAAERLVGLSLGFACGGGLVLLLPLAAGLESLAALVAGMMLLAFGIGLILASGPICLLDASRSGSSGPASALVGSLQLAAASLAGFLVGSFHDGTAWPMAATIAAFVAIGTLSYCLIRPGADRKPRD